ncbi:MAG TPA: DUF6152 family protein [Gammaproteobacteria bacterium]
MRFIVILPAIALSVPAWGHHSDAGLDMENVTSVEGTVTGYYFRNPHVYFTVAVPGETGEPVVWSMQMGSAITMTRRGWSRDSLAVGDQVAVEVHASIDGRPYGLVENVEKEGGAVSNAPMYQPAETASTDSLEGLWMANSSELVAYPGGFDGFFTANLELTEAGRQARDAYDQFSGENPEASCVGRPTPAMLVSTNLYPIWIEFAEDEEMIYIRSQFWDEERVVYMDGRAHPPASERTVSGHSTGTWEGDTLVVETTNFADHRSPYQIGVPSGAQKRVVERYRLLDGGERISMEFALEDPEFIAAPLTHSRELIYSPHLGWSEFDCDPEASERFLLTR